MTGGLLFTYVSGNQGVVSKKSPRLNEKLYLTRNVDMLEITQGVSGRESVGEILLKVSELI